MISSHVPEDDVLRGSGNKEVGNSEYVQEGLALRRSTRECKRPEKFKDYHLNIDHRNICECFFAGPIDEYEPKSFEEAHRVVQNGKLLWEKRWLLS